MTAAQPYLAGNPKGGSPIAEALTPIAMAAVHTDSRIFCVISDAREVSAIGGTSSAMTRSRRPRAS